jgi:protein PhnA
MSQALSCPVCSMTNILAGPGGHECGTCGHEWSDSSTEANDGPRIVKDANGNVLTSGDSVSLIKDLRLKGGSRVLKGGTKIKNIRLVEGDHEIDCKIDGEGMMLKACFVKKAAP